MPRTLYTTVLARGWFTIAVFSLLGLVLSLAISFIQPLKYSSTIRLLVLQNIGSNVDAFTASRSEERIAENLSTIIYTTTFFGQVIGSGFTIDERTFPTDDARRRRAWRKTIAATVSRGAGILTVSAYHPDVAQAEQIVRAVGAVLQARVGEYTSGGNVEVRLIDEPLNSRWPVKPNLIGNGISGLVLGGLFGTAYVLLQADRIRRRHQLVHEEF